VFVCLSVCQLAYLENLMPSFVKFYVHVDCGHGFILLSGVAIRYVLLVLWMTSCFHTVGLIVRHLYSWVVKV